MAFRTITQLRKLVGIDRGKCIDLDQSTSAITFEIPESYDAANLTSFTIAFRLYAHSLGGGDLGRVMDCISGFPANEGFVNMFASSSGYNCQVFHSTTNGAAVSGANTIKLNQWQTLIMTFDDSWDNPKVYVDAVERTSSPTSKSGTRGNPSGNTAYIGNRSDSIRGFDGLMDDYFIWDRVLTDSEITAYNSGVIPSGYIHGFEMNEASGALADASGNNIVGAVTDATQNIASYSIPSRTTATDRFEVVDFVNSLLCTNNAVNVNCGNNASLHNSTFTYLAWIKLTPDFSTTNRTLIGWSGNSTPQLRINNANKINLLKQNIASIATGTTTLPNGAWIHIGASYDATGNFVLYLNGVSDGSGTSLQTFDFSTSSLLLANIVGLGQSFKGNIDNVRMYNTVLTPEQVSEIYYNETKYINSNLKGYWKFDEESGTTANDSSGSGNTGTISNGSYSTDVFMVARTAV